MRPLVKICGTTSPADAILAQSAGADCIGVVLHPPSPRAVASEELRLIRRAAPQMPLVLVTVNLSIEENARLWETHTPRALQLHGDETPEQVKALVDEGIAVWKAISGADLPGQARKFTDAGAEMLLVDAREVTDSGVIYGGTGRTSDWNGARGLVDEGFRVVLAGGLNAGNVGRALEEVRPFGVDAISGVEARAGIKDAEKLCAFVDAARANECL